MTPLFAILIATMPERKNLLQRLLNALDKLHFDDEYLIIINNTKGEKHGGPTTGRKRNDLMDAAIKAGATHIAFIDDDDLVSDNYLKAIMPGVNGDYDCCELWGQYYENGKQMNLFHHSIIHKEWWQDNKFYYRNPNHLSVIKLAHLHDIRFQEKTVGEDAWYSIDIQKTGRLKKEYPVKEIIYYYFAGRNRNHALEPVMAKNRGIKL